MRRSLITVITLVFALLTVPLALAQSDTGGDAECGGGMQTSEQMGDGDGEMTITDEEAREDARRAYQDAIFDLDRRAENAEGDTMEITPGELAYLLRYSGSTTTVGEALVTFGGGDTGAFEIPVEVVREQIEQGDLREPDEEGEMTFQASLDCNYRFVHGPMTINCDSFTQSAAGPPSQQVKLDDLGNVLLMHLGGGYVVSLTSADGTSYAGQLVVPEVTFSYAFERTGEDTFTGTMEQIPAGEAPCPGFSVLHEVGLAPLADDSSDAEDDGEEDSEPQPDVETPVPDDGSDLVS